VARPVSRFKVLDFIKPEVPLEKGDTVKVYIFRVAEEGLVTFSEQGHEVFIYYKHTRDQHRFGEALEVTITVKRDDLHYNGTLIEQKETMLEGDALRIFEYLKANDGEMPFTDKSKPDDIYEAFNMSKAAFKRGLGRLYKEGKVDLHKDKTTLKDNA